MKTVPYWLDTRPDFRSACVEPLPDKADVVVIGGGFTGLSCALATAKRGAGVVLLEADVVAAAASGRNGGQCNTGFAHDYRQARDLLGPDKAREIFQSYNAAVDTVERIVREEGIDCAFRRVGKLKLAVSPAAFDDFRRSVDLINREADPEVYAVAKADLHTEVGSDRFHGGIIYPRSAMLHVGKFGVGLAEAAARAGARLYEHTPVVQLERIAGSRYRVTTPRGSMEAGQVVIATGISRQGPFFYFRRRIVPVGSFVIATEPLDQSTVDRLIPKHRTVAVARNLGNYYRISPDNRLIFGGRAQFAVSSPRVDLRSGRILAGQMREIYPKLRDVRLDYCWGGMIEVTRDRFARAGEYKGMYYSLGYSGSGVQAATHMGTILARMLEGDASANPYRDLSWPPIPGHFGPPWFLPFVGAYYKVKDRLAA
ncbi:NAD(P)/FAD-dependent oxidoreductase [Rhodoligotrophos defluvii]|uniref:NAD(P)/FAD-dependent oxidoreductase n=1 Tax=Rhodoligotrophos defluvii TaxID=2561934 RepID=UPI0010CA0A2F|nr:FAD-binding oxidoreductase [Rhodoligotrophos defluvii]